MTEISLDEWLDKPPLILEEEAETAQRTGDQTGVIFAWYRHIGLTAHYVACINPVASGISTPDPLALGVLKGLLHRCCRLMLSNVALSHEGYFGETTKIVDRCIIESAIKLRWLCQTDRIDTFLKSSLKAELAFKQRLERDVEGRPDGEPSPIQARMLASVERHRALAGVTWEDVKTAKKFPNFDAVMADLKIDPLGYLVVQRLGSHAVHGNWSSLLDDYLRVEVDGSFGLRDADVETDINQYAMCGDHVLEACIDFVRYLAPTALVDRSAERLSSLREEFLDVYRSAASKREAERASV